MVKEGRDGSELMKKPLICAAILRWHYTINLEGDPVLTQTEHNKLSSQRNHESEPVGQKFLDV